MKRDFLRKWNSNVILTALAVTFLAAGWAAAGEYRHGDSYYRGSRYQAPRYHAPVARKPYAAAPYGYKTPGYYQALKVIDVRWIDAGIAEEKLGPAFRVVLRNVGAPVHHKFDVLLTAGAGDKLNPEFPTAVQTIDGLHPGQVLTIDMRLPIESLAMAYPGLQAPAPFDTVMVLTTAAKKKLQTLAIVPRVKILPVDIALAELKTYKIPAGAPMLLTGEGFALKPGKVVVQTRGLKLAAEILHWGPLGVEIKLPHLPLARLTPARLFVIRNDGRVSRPLHIDLDLPVVKPVIEPASAPIEGPAAGPVVGQPIAGQPVDGQPVAGQPTVAQPIVEQPVVEQPVVEQPIVEQPVVEQPAADQPVDDEPVIQLPFDPDEELNDAPVEDTPEVDADAAASAAPSVSQLIVSQLSRLLGR